MEREAAQPRVPPAQGRSQHQPVPGTLVNLEAWQLRWAPVRRPKPRGSRAGGPIEGRATHYVSKDGKSARSICPLSQTRKPRSPGSDWQLPVWPVSQGWEDSGSGHGLWLLGELPPRDMQPQVCAAGLRSSGPAGEAGRCLQGFLSGLRRLLHRLHKELPVWGCPGADQPL